MTSTTTSPSWHRRRRTCSGGRGCGRKRAAAPAWTASSSWITSTCAASTCRRSAYPPSGPPALPVNGAAAGRHAGLVHQPRIVFNGDWAARRAGGPLPSGQQHVDGRRSGRPQHHQAGQATAGAPDRFRLLRRAVAQLRRDPGERRFPQPQRAGLPRGHRSVFHRNLARRAGSPARHGGRRRQGDLRRRRAQPRGRPDVPRCQARSPTSASPR